MLSWYDGKITGKEEKWNVHMCYIGVTERKIEKEGKMRICILIFIYTIHFACLKVYTKFHNPKASSCWENWRKCTYAL